MLANTQTYNRSSLRGVSGHLLIRPAVKFGRLNVLTAEKGMKKLLSATERGHIGTSGMRHCVLIPPLYQLLNNWKLIERNNMKIKLAYVSPGGNPTALVLTSIDRLRQRSVAKKIMKKIPACEQVGFIERAKNSKAVCRLQMMGGEFCGNALRALAMWLVFVSNRKVGQFIVESSGTKEL